MKIYSDCPIVTKSHPELVEGCVKTCFDKLSMTQHLLRWDNYQIYFCLFALFFLLPSGLSAQEIRATSFDERPACEESQGVWRQFGNGCVDECRAKFDIFSICTQSLSFGCDCGKNRCWNGETCVLMADYKKTFDEEKAAEKKLLDEAKKNRQEVAKESRELIMNNLLTKLAPLGPDGKPLPVAPPLLPEQQAIPPSPTAPLPAATQPVATAPDNSLIPPFYSQQEKAKQEATNQQIQPAAPATTASAITTTTAPATSATTSSSASTSVLPGLPVIPLP